MDTEMRRATDLLSYFRQLEEKPYAYDFFQVLRRIECLYPEKPRLGEALRPLDEPLRLAQEPSMAFAPSTLSSFSPPAERRPARLEQRFFGLLGPNGPLPLHLTDYARERILHSGDPTFSRFLDVFDHRFLLLFYRAWAQAQPTRSLDRPREDRFAVYVGSVLGLAGAKVRNRDEVNDSAKLYFCGLLARHVRNRDGLAALLTGFFRVPVRVEEFVGHWLQLPPFERTRLGAEGLGARLGSGAVLGASVWDRQHKFRLWLGPLTLAQYESFLPGGTALARLVAWVRQYLCFELDWDARLILKRDQVPQTRLGQFGRLGWTSWLGTRCAPSDAGDLMLDAERLMASQAAPAQA